MKSNKLPSYIERLGIFTIERRIQPYQWGLNDCVVFAADAVWNMTGIDPIPDIRGSWTDEASAMATLMALGGMITAVDSRFPYRIENNNFIQRGDLCALKIEGSLSLGICVGSQIAAPGKDEMLLFPMNFVRVAWTV